MTTMLQCTPIGNTIFFYATPPLLIFFNINPAKAILCIKNKTQVKSCVLFIPRRWIESQSPSLAILAFYVLVGFIKVRDLHILGIP